jgi:hypothetical protein
MSTEEIVKKIVNDPILRAKYWKDVNPDLINKHTLLQSKNIYLRSLYWLLDDQTSCPHILKALLTNFNIEL